MENPWITDRNNSTSIVDLFYHESDLYFRFVNYWKEKPKSKDDYSINT